MRRLVEIDLGEGGAAQRRGVQVHLTAFRQKHSWATCPLWSRLTLTFKICTLTCGKRKKETSQNTDSFYTPSESHRMPETGFLTQISKIFYQCLRRYLFNTLDIHTVGNKYSRRQVSMVCQFRNQTKQKIFIIDALIPNFKSAHGRKRMAENWC